MNTKQIQFKTEYGESLYDYLTSPVFKSYAHRLVVNDGGLTFAGIVLLDEMNQRKLFFT